MIVDGIRHVWEEGRLFVFDDTRPHEVRNATDDPRFVLLVDFERPMRPLGRALSRATTAAVRRTRFVAEAKRAHQAWEARFLERLGGAAPPAP
jgi:beta-hydroxylase